MLHPMLRRSATAAVNARGLLDVIEQPGGIWEGQVYYTTWDTEG
jgi:hypothetical protein